MGSRTADAQNSSIQSVSNAVQLKPKNMSSFFRNYCVKCHGQRKQNGDVRLDKIETEITDHSDVSKWQDILDALNTGEMPPEEARQPKPSELQAMIGAVTDNIAAAHKRLAATGGVIKMRHLTKREYLGSMRDLFDLDLPTGILPDDVSAEFDTNGSDQFFSLKQYENFYKAGRQVVEKSLLAYTSRTPAPTTIRHDPEIAPFKAAKAAYIKMVKVMQLIDAGAPIADISKIDPKVADTGQVKLFTQRYAKRIVKPKANYIKTKGRKGVSGSFSYTASTRPHSVYKLSVVALAAGDGDVIIRVNGEKVGSVRFGRGRPKSSELSIRTGLFDSEIDIRVDGRKGDEYDFLTLMGPFEVKNSTRSFFETVTTSVTANNHPSDGDVAAMFKRFADRAFRYQGVDDEYVAELVKVYKLEKSAGKTTAAALVEPLTAVITSPAFLYIKEKNDGTRSLLGQKEFAIRLAYFLWGTPPDRELYQVAESNQLFDKAVLRIQFERMLASANADVFMTDFINQWSDISRFDEIDLPVKLIRGGFAASARREISEFFKVLVRENRPLDNLIDSDFVVVDQQLARYYRLKGDVGETFQKVALPASSARGGMLSQAAFLIIGSSGGRTSPTIRGTIVREKFLHDPPPPPPPNIPAIESAKGKKLTVKQLVDRHKNIPQCASCHEKIDPIGYGLENFDYLGLWRTTEVPGGEATGKKPKRGSKNARAVPKKVAIDARGYLGDDHFDDFDGLQQVLIQNKDQLARSIFESMLSYGIGREIEFVDNKEIDSRLNALKKNNYPLKEMLLEAISSEAFATK